MVSSASLGSASRWRTATWHFTSLAMRPWSASICLPLAREKTTDKPHRCWAALGKGPVTSSRITESILPLLFINDYSQGIRNRHYRF
jgi:hypothetical protein